MLFLDNWLLQTTHATYSILKIKSTHTNSTWLFLCMYSIKYLDKDKTEHQHSLVFELALTLKDRMRIKETNKWGGKEGRRRDQNSSGHFLLVFLFCQSGGNHRAMEWAEREWMDLCLCVEQIRDKKKNIKLHSITTPLKVCPDKRSSSNNRGNVCLLHELIFEAVDLFQ